MTLDRRARAIAVFLFCCTILVGGANLWATYDQVGAYKAAQMREHQAQQRQGAVIGRKLCTTLDSLRSLQPPPGNPAANPSRAYEQDLHARLSQLGSDLGCK